MSNWQQQLDTPLYPGVVWSRPETKHGAGKLLIVGGNQSSFAHVARAYQEAEQAGVGIIRVIVPDSLHPITKDIPYIEYAPSNPSGGFAKQALAALTDGSDWADGVLLCGDFGKNSETTLLLDAFLSKTRQLTVIDPAAYESIGLTPASLLSNEALVAIWTFDQFQKQATTLGSTQGVTSDMGKPQLAEILESISKRHAATIIVQHKGCWIAASGRVTSCRKTPESATFAVWALQQPTKRYEALVSATVLRKNH